MRPSDATRGSSAAAWCAAVSPLFTSPQARGACDPVANGAAGEHGSLATPMRHDAADEGRGRGRLGDIGLKNRGSIAQFGGQVLRWADLSVVVDGDLGARSVERATDGLANTAGAAGDQGDPLR